MTAESLDLLQKNLGYPFHDRAILLQSLTHKSYGHEFLQEKPISLRDNERMEFLGDAVLDVVVSDILLETFPEAPEGRLSKLRAAVVNEKTLAELASNLGIPACLRLGRGEAQSGGGAKPSIVSSAFEALIAAIYLDGGFNAVYPVVRHLFSPFFKESEPDLESGAGDRLPGSASSDQAAVSLVSGQASGALANSPRRLAERFQDHKTHLQELIQGRWKVTPSYHLLATSGPDHAKTFEVEVRVQGKILAVSRGMSKKDAEQNAAKEAMLGLQVQ
jgi:ribonuclease-3